MHCGPLLKIAWVAKETSLLCLHPASILQPTTRFLNTSVHTTKICGSTKIPPGDDFTFWPMDYISDSYNLFHLVLLVFINNTQQNMLTQVAFVVACVVVANADIATDQRLAALEAKMEARLERLNTDIT